MKRRGFFGSVFSGLVTSTLKGTAIVEDENHEKFNNAITLLKNPSLFKKNTGASELYLLINQGLTESELKILFSIIDDGVVGGQTEGSILIMLANHKSETTREYFLKIFPAVTDHIAQLAVVKYFIRSGFEDLLVPVRFKIINSVKQYESFVGIIGFIATDEYGKEAMVMILNDVLLIENLQQETLKMLKVMIEGYLTAVNFEKEYNSSHLKKFLDKVKGFGEQG